MADLNEAMVQYPSDGVTVRAYLVGPQAKGARAAIIVVQEWWGLNDHIKDISRRYAREGYVAIAPDLYSRLGHTVTADPNEAGKLMNALRQEDGLKDLNATVAYLKTVPAVDANRVGVTGFCMGGSYALMLPCVNPTIKAQSAIFGETLLNVTDLAGIHWLGKLAELELEVDGAKYAVNALQWMDTGIELDMNDELVISAFGKVDLMPNGGGQGISGPEGSAQFPGQPGIHPPGALLGRIGENGSAFLIGGGYNGTSKSEGRLYLQISTSPWAHRGANAVTGSYKVRITGGRDTQDR